MYIFDYRLKSRYKIKKYDYFKSHKFIIFQ